MIKEIITKAENHKNGTLFFEEKIGIIDPLFVESHKNNSTLIFNKEENIYFIRLETTKHFDNGQFAWSLKWDEKGNLLNKGDKAYRKDGTVIEF